ALTEAVYYILLALVEPMHGYGIMQQTAALSNGRVRLSAGTLYGALASLLDKGWIEQLPEDGRKKDYRITSAGREVLRLELLRLAELLENGRNILQNE
ncbi:MAG: helix-turn-helix transcriptional regulator, partial [Bacteroidales bacterium]|nr:helix-turn-helix transcriptional regulator [Bacteroidales bacterium]